MAEPVSEDLERAYDQSVWSPNMQEVLARYRLASDAARSALGPPLRISYGHGDHESLDVYRARRKNTPIVVFVHGGAWRGGAARDYAFPAEMLVAAGIAFVAVDFSTVDDAKGELAVLVDQVCRAVAWVHRNCGDFGGDPALLHVVGHSTGAHLAAMALSSSWAGHGLPENPIRGGMLISGTYDLHPLRRTSRVKFINLGDDVVWQLSPLHQIARLSSPILLAVGSKESPETRRQTYAYGQAATQAGKQVELIVGEAYTHFDILETLADPDGLLGRNLLRLVQSAPG